MTYSERMPGWIQWHDNGKSRPTGEVMEQKPIQQQAWFRIVVAVLTLLCGIAVFSFAGLAINTVTTALIAFLCLMGLERVLSSLLGMLALLLRARRSRGA
jgi:uncharacterized membrane protein HdeD (DUF308 family)